MCVHVCTCIDLAKHGCSCTDQLISIPLASFVLVVLVEECSCVLTEEISEVTFMGSKVS